MPIAKIELHAGRATMQIAPFLGGGIIGICDGERPVLRPFRPRTAQVNPFDLGAIILAPFSNRIGRGSFDWQGATYLIERNLPAERFPIHGDSFQRSWAAMQHDNKRATLRLEAGGIGPFRYAAEQLYDLSAGGFRWTLKLTNLGKMALPFGFGFHPWFPRDEATRLRFSSKYVTLNDERDLPREKVQVSSIREFSFDQLSVLPDDMINNGFEVWDGVAEVEQGARFVSVRLEASVNLSTAIVYSPGKEADFFCFEPVSHPINAHNDPAKPGLVVLEPGDEAECEIRLEW